MLLLCVYLMTSAYSYEIIPALIGDEVLEWNGRLLQGATFEDVYNIILESKPEPQVELVVSRPIG